MLSGHACSMFSVISVWLGQQVVPLIDGEARMCTHEDREKMPTKCLDGALGLVGAFLIGMVGTRCTWTCCCSKKRTSDAGHSLSKTWNCIGWPRCLKNWYVHTKAAPRLDSVREGSSSAWIYVSFVLQYHDVLRTVEGGDRKPAG
jgi:hypothetical protein